MPTYDYQCRKCGTVYDVFHKVREVAEDVLCPSCGAREHVRLLSAPNVAKGGRSSSEPSGGCSPEFGGCCGGGSCGLN
ncbi:MAG: zinc ribbon domain-containing protein [Bacteroidota bacterium]